MICFFLVRGNLCTTTQPQFWSSSPPPNGWNLKPSYKTTQVNFHFFRGFRLLVSFRGLVKKMCHWPMMRLQKKQFAKTNVHKMVMQWWWNPKVRKKITFLQIQDHHTAVSLAHSVHPTSCNCNQSYRASWLEFLPLQLVATEWHRAICSGAHKRW